jgi:hypothetical protein
VRRRGLYLTATFSTEADTEAWRASAIVAIERGETPEIPTRPGPAAPVRPVTIEDACREWSREAKAGMIRTRRGHSYKPATLRGAESRLRLYVVARLGAVPLHAAE